MEAWPCRPPCPPCPATSAPPTQPPADPSLTPGGEAPPLLLPLLLTATPQQREGSSPPATKQLNRLRVYCQMNVKSKKHTLMTRNRRGSLAIRVKSLASSLKVGRMFSSIIQPAKNILKTVSASRCDRASVSRRYGSYNTHT